MIRSRGLSAVVLVGLALSLTARAGDFEARYSATLAELDQKRPESVCAARETLRTLLPQSSSADRASMFRGFLKFTVAVARNNGESLDAALAPVLEEAFAVLENAHWKSGSASDYLRSNPQVRRAIEPWLECGFGLYVSEGMFTPASTWQLSNNLRRCCRRICARGSAS